MDRARALIQQYHLTPLHLTLLSLFVAASATAASLVVGIGYFDPVGILLIAGGAVLTIVVASSLRPQIAIYILMVTLVSNLSYIFTDLGLPGVNKPLIALLMLSVGINSMIRGSFNMRVKSIEWLMLAYGATMMVSYFGAADQDVALEEMVEYAKNIIIMFCMAYALKSEADWKRSLWLVIGTMTVLSAMGTYQVLSGDYDQTFWGFATIKRDQVLTDVWQMRLNGPIYDPNFFGLILVGFMPLSLYRIFDATHLPTKVFSALSVLLNIIANLNTYSRASFITMGVILFVIALERRVKMGFLFLVVFCVMIIMPFLPEGYTERLETLSVFGSEDETSAVHGESSFRGRTSELLSGIHMFLDRPFTGVGPGNYEVRYQEYAGQFGLEDRTTIRQAHSLYIEIAAEGGLLGITSLMGVFVALFVGLHRARRKVLRFPSHAYLSSWITSLQMALAAYLINSIFLHSDFWRYLWVLVAFGVAIIHLTDDLEAAESPNSTAQKAEKQTLLSRDTPHA
jgi:hypothetical protein